MLQITKQEKEYTNARFSENALRMMKKRYLVVNGQGEQETPADLFLRVARALAEVEKAYGKGDGEIDQITKDFFDVLANKEFTPAGRTLRNAGNETVLIANCVVLPIEDSMEGIFQTLKEASLLQQVGCGLGFDLSSLRPVGFPTKRTQGEASGPVSFLRVYNEAFRTVKQQGRHGANMAMMRIDHPDILDFIHAKNREGEIECFNISVTVTDEFMNALEQDPNQAWHCKFKDKKTKPRMVSRYPNGSVYNIEEVDMSVGQLWQELVHSAWLNGEPGIVFIDTVNKTNPLPGLGPIATSNPCAEQFLHPYDNCNLGSINLAAFVKEGRVDWDRLSFVTRTAVRMLDNVIDKFDFPVAKLNEMARGNRRIGLGIMGFADMLYQLRIQYNSRDGLEMAEKVMGFVQDESHKMSEELAAGKGIFPNYHLSVFAKQGIKQRNAALTTVAPTGSISMMTDASSGIEPNFALAYVKQDKDGMQYRYFNTYFEQALNQLNLSSEEKELVKKEIIEKGTIQHLKNLPEDFRDVFVISMDMSGKEHMQMQAAFQKHVDNSISKTINFPNSATEKEVSESFADAWQLGCKSCTVYREGSRVIQVLNLGTGENIAAPTGAPSQKGGGSFGGSYKKISPRPRPEVMNGKTYRVKTGYGNLYVTINSDEKGEPFEVFANIGKSGGFFQEQSEAITRLISLALRSGIKVEKVIDDLKGIRGPMPIFTDKGTILSLPDAIGKILEQHVTGTPQVEDLLQKPENQEAFPFVQQEDKSIADLGFMPGCPECGSPLAMAEGCISCKNCGFSRCT
ncbi:MAG: adenosylcobalamin-dependent ribonucleoside-diphosphate reductase [Candidatus Wildermuthbacteria bacterium]|nr:adenosylcobalamin-dependent ribonucleoside-diphosphate reductase [Candidatus Wildermuthbacteria bacterium]